MGAVPKHKTSTMRKGKRRRAINVSRKNISLCPQCQQPKLSHQSCGSCGQYKTNI